MAIWCYLAILLSWCVKMSLIIPDPLFSWFVLYWLRFFLLKCRWTRAAHSISRCEFAKVQNQTAAFGHVLRRCQGKHTIESSNNWMVSAFMLNMIPAPLVEVLAWILWYLKIFLSFFCYLNRNTVLVVVISLSQQEPECIGLSTHVPGANQGLRKVPDQDSPQAVPC